MARIRVAVIGCGSIVEWAHLPVLTGPDIVTPYDSERARPPYNTLEAEKPKALPKVVALCDLNPERLNKLGERYNISKRFTDYRDMLDKVQLDALVVAVSPQFNVEIIPQAIKRGLHIFVEKPMTNTLREALEIQRIVEGSDVVVQVGFMRRFYYAYRNAKRLINAGEIGEIQAVNGWAGWTSAARGADIHIVDIIQFFAGPAVEVYAKRRGHSIAATIEFENGAVGNLFQGGTGRWNTVNERFEIVGTEFRHIIAENGRRLYLSCRGKPSQFQEPPQVLHWITGYDLNGFAGEHRHFLDCIVSGKQSIAGVESGVYSIRLKEGIEWSIKEGKTIKLDIPSVKK